MRKVVSKCLLALLVAKNTIPFSDTSGANEYFETLLCIYLESARRVLSDEHNMWPSGARERFFHVYVVLYWCKCKWR